MSEGTKNVVTTEEGALSVKKLTFWEAAAISHISRMGQPAFRVE